MQFFFSSKVVSFFIVSARKVYLLKSRLGTNTVYDRCQNFDKFDILISKIFGYIAD